MALTAVGCGPTMGGTDDEADPMAHANRPKPFLCRTNLHHSWGLAHTEDGARFVRCGRCLKERGSGGGNGTGPGAMSAGSSTGISGGTM
jgi:hypothetical protein